MSVFITPIIAVWSLLIAFMTGACFASFVDCAVYRRARGQTALKGRSACPFCGHTLAFFEIIPIFSYLILRGKCRVCGASLSRRYLTVELIGGLSFSLLIARWGITLLTLKYMILAVLLLAISLWDIEKFEVSNLLLAVSFGTEILFLPLCESEHLLILLRNAVLGAVIIGGIMLVLSLVADKIMKRDTLGGGDIKLYALLGFCFGPLRGVFLLMLSCVIGIIFSFLTGVKRREPFPFAPSIALAALVTALCGDLFVNWYLSLLM